MVWGYAFEAQSIEFDQEALMKAVGEACGKVGIFFDNNNLMASRLPTPPRRRFPQDYPLEWTPEERRDYFQKVARGETTFPYRRTGFTQNQWIIVGRTTGSIDIQNLADHARDVFGDFDNKASQKKYHAITGWIAVRDVRDAVVDQLTNAVNEEVQLILGSTVLFKGVPI